jgi:ATP/maltotriose-dependent transcriptional regulator MalT
MSSSESRAILGSHPDFEHVVAQAEGWPAVIGLAASARTVRLTGQPQLPSNLLHTYFTEELFKAAGERIQHQLMRLALAPDLAPDSLRELFGKEADELREDATNFGFVSSETGADELHPLVRDFLFVKLSSVAESQLMVTDAVAACLRRERWDRAFELILRFGRDDLVEAALGAAYMPLIRSGQTGTLGSFATKVRAAPAFPPAVVDLAEADIALADGSFDLASRIAERAAARLGEGHELAARAHTIIAEGAYARGLLADAEQAYKAAFEAARSDDDRVAALRGWALSCLQGEVNVPPWVMQELEQRKSESPLDLVRYSILELIRRHCTTGYLGAEALIEEAAAVLHQVDDPRARSSLANVAAYVTALGARYRAATSWLKLCDSDIEEFDLDFARPHSLWNHALVACGLRKFGHAERLLQRLEDTIQDNPLDYHLLNARILRGRLALETQKADAALASLPLIKREVVIPSVHGEYLGTRALALAVAGELHDAQTTAAAATEATGAVEVRVLEAAVAAIVCKEAERTEFANRAWDLAEELGAWDPLVTCIRASRDLANAFSANESLRPSLAALYQRTNDLGLARRGGLRARAAGSPAELLSPRELEVLGLIARGYRNHEIASALVLSLSTVKVHVRHIFEKLGVRSRSEAVTRLTAIS